MSLSSDTFGKYIGVIPLLIAACLYWIGDHFIRGQTEPVANEKFAALWREIGPHPSFVPRGECETRGKQPYALLYSCAFTSFAEYPRVSNYYVDKMTALNWKKMKETRNRLWGVDKGSRSIFFCDDKHQLSIEYSNKNFDWDYVIVFEDGCSSQNS